MPIYYLRLRTLAIPLLFAFTTLMVLAGHASAQDIDPAGIGDLMPSPTSKVPAGQGTLYESYSNPNLWQLDSDYGKWDILDPMAEAIADICMALIAVIGTAVVVIVTWIFQLTSIPALENAITKSIGGASEGLTVTLLPTALAVGGLVAFAQHKRGGGGGGLSQLAWVLVSGVVSVSLLSSPGTWVSGVDSARQIGAGVAMNATAQGLGDGSGDFPFKIGHEPQFSGNGRDDMLRKSADAVWRSYVATPWCVAEFGSFKACELYGKQVLDKGANKDARKQFLQDNVSEDAVGGDSAQWRRGHSPVGRIMVCLPSLLSIVIFAALVLMLAFTSLASLLGALMLLVAGVFFACLWVIPGRPRQWGLRWFDQLLGRTLESFIATLVLGCVLTINTATTQLFDQYGWLPSSGLSIAAAVVAFRFRSIVSQIVGVSGGSSPGTAIMGLLAARRASQALSGLLPGRGSPHHPQPVRTLRGRDALPGGGGGGGDGDGPPLPSIRPPAPPPPSLPAPRNPPALPAGPGGGGPNPPGPRPLPPGPPSAPTITLERDHTPPTPRSIPPRPRPALPAGTGTATPTANPRTPSARRTAPTSVLRPESAAIPQFGFRQAPAPGPANPRIIPATVIRSTPNGPPRRTGRTQPPARTTAPASRRVPRQGRG
ncbi:hypothetical protein QMK19_33990 [Streptomyces sp. H10-C2]|uniref:hypothetical protein n=1 Tax=unclassified Streptomyces TaxID=2593676 RepID=UPI0024B92802|nr:MULTISPECIES: hypothetical protein [unclassified Streptomyces]MDJ0345560.1 hypothetical protein [Streptomyces sp. PH10-H1]MDJ0374506.1 hypothetical protein [Streptomyces sp. H10-C2]